MGIVGTTAGPCQEDTVPLELSNGVLLVIGPDGVSLTDTTATEQFITRVDSKNVGALIVRATQNTDVADNSDTFGFPVLGETRLNLDAVGRELLAS